MESKVKLKTLSPEQLSEYIGLECPVSVSKLVLQRLIDAEYEDTIQVPDSVWNQIVEVSYWEVFCPKHYELFNDI
jgi:hypothetical protein